MYIDSVWGFKDKWYVLQSVTQTTLDSMYEEDTAVVDENGEPLMDAEGRLAMGSVSKFPLHWCSRHYEHGTGNYHTPAGGMSVEDEEAYGTLCKYVDSFFPARWVTREGEDILDEEGYPIFEARPIDTKVLVECQSYGQAVDLLGCFCLIVLFQFLCLLLAHN